MCHVANIKRVEIVKIGIQGPIKVKLIRHDKTMEIQVHAKNLKGTRMLMEETYRYENEQIRYIQYLKFQNVKSFSILSHHSH